MHKILRGAFPLLLAASAFGLTRPAAAQAPAPFPQTAATADAGTPDGVPPLPRVVTPKRPTPTAPGTTPTASLAPAKAGVDLLTPPAVPSAWSVTPTQTTTAPNITATMPAPAYKPTASYPASMTPPARSPYSPATPLPLAVRQAFQPDGQAEKPDVRKVSPAALTPLPPIVQARPILTPKPVVVSAAPVVPAPLPKKVWPAAFVTHDETKPYETTGVVYFDKTAQPMKQTEAFKPASVVAVAAAPADLRGHVAAKCGADAVSVVTTKRPDGTTLVKVRVRDAAAERNVMDKILQMSELAQPTVRVMLEVKP